MQAGDTSVGWALGYMLSLSSLLPEESVGLRKALKPGAWGALLFLLALLIVAALVNVVQLACTEKKKGSSSDDVI